MGSESRDPQRLHGGSATSPSETQEWPIARGVQCTSYALCAYCIVCLPIGYRYFSRASFPVCKNIVLLSFKYIFSFPGHLLLHLFPLLSRNIIVSCTTITSPWKIPSSDHRIYLSPWDLHWYICSCCCDVTACCVLHGGHWAKATLHFGEKNNNKSTYFFLKRVTFKSTDLFFFNERD